MKKIILEKIIIGHKDAYVTGKFKRKINPDVSYLNLKKDIKEAYHFDSFNDARMFVDKKSTRMDISEFHFRIVEIETIIDRLFEGKR